MFGEVSSNSADGKFKNLGLSKDTGLPSISVKIWGYTCTPCTPSSARPVINAWEQREKFKSSVFFLLKTGSTGQEEIGRKKNLNPLSLTSYKKEIGDQRFVSSIGNIEKAMRGFNYLGRSG